MINFLLPVSWLVLASSSPPVASESSDAVMAATDIAWLKTPSNIDMDLAYPRAAFRNGVSGSATLNCAAGDHGYLSDCRLLSENPAGAGFGLAAIRLSAKYQLAEHSKSGRAQRRVRISFALGFSTE
jgi:periplasmic protein TonB